VFFPRVFLLNGIVIGNLLINRIADGWQGQVTAVDIALSIQGVFFSLITSASTVFFPNIAKTYHAAHGRVFWKRIFKFLEGVSVLSVIGTVATVIGVPIVLWIFTLFQKDFNNVEYIILLTRIAAVGIVLQSGVEILSKYIYIKERVWQPAIMSMSGVIVQVFCTFWLRYVLEVDAGISVIIGIIVNYAVLFLYMFLVSVGDRNRDLFEN
jgi:peptidoglycan biosynthesis protein MviN/MurJ (putative lipid II flippase)